MSKILTPSDINFLKDSKDGLLTKPNDDVLTELIRQFREKNQVPKIQVSQMNGAWFALNNTSLHLIKELEKQGRCSQVQVEIVPLSKVPESLQKGMIIDKEIDQQSKDNHSAKLLDSKGAEKPEVSKEVKIEKKSQRKLQIEENLAIEAELCNIYKNGSTISCDADPGSSANSSSDYSDYDQDYEDSECEESLICNVCDRSFATGRQLGKHQLHRKHFCCSVCDALFPNLTSLQLHKETLQHWSDDEIVDNELSDDCDEETFNVQPYEEVERLL